MPTMLPTRPDTTHPDLQPLPENHLQCCVCNTSSPSHWDAHTMIHKTLQAGWVVSHSRAMCPSCARWEA